MIRLRRHNALFASLFTLLVASAGGYEGEGIAHDEPRLSIQVSPDEGSGAEALSALLVDVEELSRRGIGASIELKEPVKVGVRSNEGELACEARSSAEGIVFEVSTLRGARYGLHYLASDMGPPGEPLVPSNSAPSLAEAVRPNGESS